MYNFINIGMLSREMFSARNWFRGNRGLKKTQEQCPPLTDNIQLEEVLQVRVRQGRVLAAALEDLAVVVGDGWEYQGAQDHRRVAIVHYLLAHVSIKLWEVLVDNAREEVKSAVTSAYQSISLSTLPFRNVSFPSIQVMRARGCEPVVSQVME